MIRENRIKNYNFSVGSLTANSDGLFSVYSDHSINGTIHSVSIGSNTYTNTGSLLLFLSGTDNGINNQDLILQTRTGSRIQTFYPVHVGNYLTSIPTGAGSTAYVNPIVNGPLRLVGSALGDGTSGLYYSVRYI